MKKFGARLYGAVIPGCEGFELHSDDYWACLCRHQTMTVYHYSGTAKMGPSEKSGEYMLTGTAISFSCSSAMPVKSQNQNKATINWFGAQLLEMEYI